MLKISVGLRGKKNIATKCTRKNGNYPAATVMCVFVALIFSLFRTFFLRPTPSIGYGLIIPSVGVLTILSSLFQ